ncbi:MAG: hypothetical protein U0350_09350 [Caldilineaceae bacterium]
MPRATPGIRCFLHSLLLFWGNYEIALADVPYQVLVEIPRTSEGKA